MVASVRAELDQAMGRLDLLDCIYGLGERDQRVFVVLERADEGLSVDDVADRLDCDRSTAHRSISRLREVGLVDQQQVNYDTGGYYYEYHPHPPDEVARDMQRLLNDWYATVSLLIGRFEDVSRLDATDGESRPVQSCPLLGSGLVAAELSERPGAPDSR